MTDIIVIAVILLIVGAASAYIIKAKKSGKKCIGCPDSCSCSAKSKKAEDGTCGSCCNCGKESN
ncbi:MAG: FeoB-associated Cys-rich membrane protein [Clostridia bacterium]|nr:FeoB-associated Cys-rich membrane protein [Clostridia bacterium]